MFLGERFSRGGTDHHGVSPLILKRDFGLYQDITLSNISFDCSSKSYRVGTYFSSLFARIENELFWHVRAFERKFLRVSSSAISLGRSAINRGAE